MFSCVCEYSPLMLNVDLADAVAVALGDVVDQVELARLFEKPGIGLDVGEHVADAAVLVLKRPHVGGHAGLIEVLVVLEFQVGQQFLVACISCCR